MPVRDKTCVSLLPLRSSAHTPNRLHCLQYNVLCTIIMYNAILFALQCTLLTCCTPLSNTMHCSMHYIQNCLQYPALHMYNAICITLHCTLAPCILYMCYAKWFELRQVRLPLDLESWIPSQDSGYDCHTPLISRNGSHWEKISLGWFLEPAQTREEVRGLKLGPNNDQWDQSP